MANNHIISIEREARLSVDLGRLKICFPSDNTAHYIAFIDIAVVIAAHPQITFSLGVLRELARTGAVIVTTDEKFMPCALNIPLGINLEGAKRAHSQAKFFNSQERGIWWAQIVRAKILGQAKSSELFNKTLNEKLAIIAKKVMPADKDCMEAYAAQTYWPEYFSALGCSVSYREKQGASEPVNIALNYAYAVLRAIVARGLASAGLCLNLGVGHCRKDNPFNLVDDFIEPFRFLADITVFDIFSRCHYKEFNSEVKKLILSELLKTSVNISGREYRLFQAVDFSVNSFCVSLEDPRRKLLLPNQPESPGKKAAQITPPIQFEYET
ncbi:MAG: type II CRISPR-associated endonuclease Cas1 [Elusimicrobiaceae bacterium]